MDTNSVTNGIALGCSDVLSYFGTHQEPHYVDH